MMLVPPLEPLTRTSWLCIGALRLTARELVARPNGVYAKLHALQSFDDAGRQADQAEALS